MRIEQQTNYQECGICCMAMLLSHYQNTYISKNDVHNICNLNPNGLSLYDIENLGLQNDLLLESYETEWEEIFRTKPKNPFILVVKNKSGLHYVVGKYKKEKIHIYDPLQKTKKTYTKTKKLENFYNIFISTKLNNINIDKEKILNDKQVMKHFSVTYFLKIFFFSIIILMFNVLSSFFMAILFKKITNKQSDMIILALCIIIVIITLLNALIQYFISIIKQKHIKKTYLIYLNLFTLRLSQKHVYFFNSISKSFFINYYTILKEYLVFYINLYIELTMNLIFLFLCIVILVIINPFILIIFLLINIFSFIIKWIYKNNTIKKEEKNISKYEVINNHLINLFDYNKNNFDLKYNNKIFEEILFELKRLEKINYNYSVKSLNLNFINTNYFKIVNMIIYIGCVLFTDYNITTLVFTISLLNYMNSSSSSLVQLFIEKKLNKIGEEILQTLLKNNNLITNNKGNLDNEIIDLEYKIENKIFNKNLFIKMLNQNNQIEFILENFYINNQKLKSYKDIYWKFVYYSFNNVENKFEDLNSIIYSININLRNDFVNYLQVIQKTKFIELSIIQRLLIILFFCSNLQNKIIVLDLPININSEQYEYDIVYKILNIINTSNFIIFINEPIINNYTNNFLLYE